jgi:hypothetical protein
MTGERGGKVECSGDYSSPFAPAAIANAKKPGFLKKPGFKNSHRKAPRLLRSNRGAGWFFTASFLPLPG